MTAIYWAAKHYRELGDPEYIGFDHYRCFLEWTPEQLVPGTVVAHRWFSWRTLRGQFGCCHRVADLDVFAARVKEWMPNSEHAPFDAYWRSHFLYLANCFIMGRDDFFRYFGFIEKCLETAFGMIDANVIDRSSYDPGMKRVYGFMLERMTGYWIWRERRRRSIRLRHAKMVHYDIGGTAYGAKPDARGLLSYFRQAR